MAYATLLSITQSLEQIMNPQPHHQSLLLDETEQQMITSLQEKATLLLSFLENDSLKYSESDLESRIRDTAYKAEAMFEYGIRYKNRSQTEIHHHESCLEFGHHNLKKTVQQFDSLLEEVVKMKERDKANDLQPTTKSLPSASSQSGSTDKTDVIPRKEMMIEIKDRLTRSPPSRREIISIVGMPGIGKTTLTKTLYDDPLLMQHFDVRAWITVSQDYNQQQMLNGLLDSIKNIISGSNLTDSLHKTLKQRRYLIVMDDVWDKDAWDQVRRYLPDDNNGSRVILTTRLQDVAVNCDCPESIYHPSLLSPDESWKILCQKVFKAEHCPRILEGVGKDIANNCKGLPLSLAVIGGILYEVERTLDYWSYVVQNINSALSRAPDEVMNILSLSYKHLPHHLRACFLYVGVFPQDCYIEKSKLIKFWIAEGFIKPAPSKSLEEVAQEYLKNLVDRSMIFYHEHNYVNVIETCGIHDLMRDLCMRIAQEEKFIKVVNSELEIPLDYTYYFRHVYFRANSKGKKFHERLAGIYGMLPRFVECSPNESSNTNLSSCVSNFHLLRVLDYPESYFDMFEDEIENLIALRYIHFCCRVEDIEIPLSISKLSNLQTLAISNWDSTSLPLEIWMMSRLRHIEMIHRCFLPCPIDAENVENFVPLENLQTLTGVTNFIFSEDALGMMPNLKNLGIRFTLQDGGTDLASYGIDNLVLLHKLEVLDLEILFDIEGYSLPENFLFPPTLEKLTLQGSFRLSAKNMASIVSLKHLQKLYVGRVVFDGSLWEPTEGEFPQLQSLTISGTNLEYLKADETNFPILQQLCFFYCSELKEIPSRIADIPTLWLIEVHEDATSLEDSVEFIRNEQQEMGNDRLQIFYYSDEKSSALRQRAVEDTEPVHDADVEEATESWMRSDHTSA